MRKIVLLNLVALLVFSCSESEEVITDESICDSEVIINAEEYANVTSNEFTINNIEIEDDCLKVSISASGCDGNTWDVKLIDSEAILESFPIQRNLAISLALVNQELCQAVITKEVTFDISKLQIDGCNSIRLNIANYEESILYEYGEDDGTGSKQLITDGIDVDGDGKLDFELDEYELQTHDVPSSTGVRHFYLKPLNENQLLSKEDEKNLFLVSGNVIKNETEEGFKWQSDLIEVIYKGRTFEVYEEFWSIHSDLTDDFHLAFKLINDTEERIGWLKLEFDLVTGEIYLLDSVITSSIELTI